MEVHLDNREATPDMNTMGEIAQNFKRQENARNNAHPIAENEKVTAAYISKMIPQKHLPAKPDPPVINSSQ